MTTDLASYAIPAPTDWQTFERLCRDLWAHIWGDADTQLNGRSGQKQAGVDVFGTRSGDGCLSGVQCKRRGKIADSGVITEQALRAEVTKAKSFKPQLKGEFILAFTGKRDAKIQKIAREITDAHAKLGLFQVFVYSWDDICERLGDHVEVWRKHYADMVATVRMLDGNGSNELNVPSADAPARVRSNTQATPAMTPGDISTNDAEYGAAFDLVRATLDSGQPGLALGQAEALRARIWSIASPGLRARLLILIGHSHLAVGLRTEAARVLVEAAGYAPNDAAVQAQVALGHSLAGNIEAARKWSAQALAQNPTDIVAIQVAAFHAVKSDEEVCSEYESVIGKRSELYAVLGHRAAIRQDFPLALSWFEKSIELDGENPEVLAVTGQLIVESVRDEVYSKGYESEEGRQQLLRGVELLDKAIARLVDDGARRARATWYGARIVAKQLLRASDVVSTADEALRVCGPQEDLVRLCAAVASDASDHAKVVQLLESLPEPRGVDDKALLAAALGNLGDLAKSTRLWEELLARRDLTERSRHDALRNLMFSLLLQKREAEATSAIEEILRSSPDALSPILVAVSMCERLGDDKRRDELLERAIAVAAPGASFLLLQLGDVLIRVERWGEAADIYERAVGADKPNVYSQRWLYCLFKAGRFDSALKACDVVEAKTGASRFLVELKSSIYELLGDLDRAEKLCRDFLSKEPRNAPISLRLVVVLRRRGYADEAQRVLETIDSDALDDIQSETLLAQMLLASGKNREALEIAFRMRRRHIDDVEAHLRYVSIYTDARGAEELEGHDQVALDSAVQLEGLGAPGWIWLCDSETADLNQKEYPRGHALTVALLGKHVGDTMAIGGAENPWSVAAIGTKYGYAFGRTLELFPSHFPTNREIEQYHASADGDEFVDQLKQRMRQGEAQRQSVLTLYSAGRCGIGCLAIALGRTNLEAIGIVLRLPSGLLCTTNGLDERSYSLELLGDQTAPLVLDLTAIVTLDGLGLLRDGLFGTRRLLVAQKTLDELSAEALRWKPKSAEGRMMIGLEGDNLVRYETTREEEESIHRHFQGLFDWLRSRTEVVAVPTDVAERYATREQIGEHIGASFWDSICIATTPGVLLVSEDLWLRRAAKSLLAVDSVCTPLFLMSEQQAGRLERERYNEAIVKLIVSGYQTISVDASILATAARIYGWQLGDAFEKVLKMLRGPNTTPESAILVGAEFIRAVWLNVLISQRRSAFLIAVLDALVAGRNRMSVLRYLRAHVQRFLALHPLAQDEVLRIVAGWDAMGVVEVCR